MIRGSRAPLTVPNPLMLFTEPSGLRYRLVIAGLVRPAKLIVLLMPENCGWLNTLNASARSSIRALLGEAKALLQRAGRSREAASGS